MPAPGTFPGLSHVQRPDLWGMSLSGAPVIDARIGNAVPALVRRWQGIDPVIDQASLDHHFVSVHLGGAKRLSRDGECGNHVKDVNEGAYSIVPAGAAFRWNTLGPVDFMHVYFDPAIVARVIADAFDRDPAHVELRPELGADDPLVRALALALLDEVAVEDRQQAYLDDLLHLMLCRTLRLHSNARESEHRAQHRLAPYRLRRAIDFVECHIGDQIGVAEIAEASGISRFHFSRAFRESTGRAPYAYLLERRVDVAKQMLIGGDEPLATIARDCGFTSPNQFSRLFKRATGATPSRYRQKR